MNSKDEQLALALRSLEDADWVPDPRARRASGAMRRVAIVSGAIGLLLGVGAGFVIAAGVLESQNVAQSNSVFAEGQPLYCSGLDDMTLPEADRFIRDKGYTVFWQIERGDATTVEEAPPSFGTIAGGVAFDHTIQIIVDPTGTERHAAPGCN